MNRYSAILQRFWRIFEPLESSLAIVLQDQLPGYYPGRMRTPHLKTDLAYLGVDANSVPVAPDVPEIADLPSALGSLYVIEGSTLGGQIISRQLAAILGLAPGRGADFFWGYGERTGKMWQEYVSLLESHANAQNSARILEAARKTFQCFLTESTAFQPNQSK